jgi:hypothetical protein
MLVSASGRPRTRHRLATFRSNGIGAPQEPAVDEIPRQPIRRPRCPARARGCSRCHLIVRPQAKPGVPKRHREIQSLASRDRRRRPLTGEQRGIRSPALKKTSQPGEKARTASHSHSLDAMEKFAVPRRQLRELCSFGNLLAPTPARQGAGTAPLVARPAPCRLARARRLCGKPGQAGFVLLSRARLLLPLPQPGGEEAPRGGA